MAMRLWNVFKNNLSGFLSFLFQSPLTFMATLFVICFTICYPGENIYLTKNILPQPKLLKQLSFESVKLHPYPMPIKEATPSIQAGGAVVIDVDSGVVMYEKNAKGKLHQASTTKIMTALVAIEKYSLSDVVRVSRAKVEGSSMKLVEGEQIRTGDLLYGMLLKSGNDAAMALADYYPGGENAFMEEMNVKAKELSLFDTHFINPIGLDDKDHYSTAFDLARLTAYAISNETFKRIVGTKQQTVYSIDGKYVHFLENINLLLGSVRGVDGVKTGYTEDAGECLVATAQRNGRRIVTVVLNSPDRFGESTKLIEWAFSNHKWEDISYK